MLQKASAFRSPGSNKQVGWRLENGGTGEKVIAAYLKDIKGNSAKDWKSGEGVGNRRHERGKGSEKTNFFHIAFLQA